MAVLPPFFSLLHAICFSHRLSLSSRQMDCWSFLPLFSLPLRASLGCSCIFLIGHHDRDSTPIPILLRSGDAIIMSGYSRLCYHGMCKEEYRSISFALCFSSFHSALFHFSPSLNPPFQFQYSFSLGFANILLILFTALSFHLVSYLIFSLGKAIIPLFFFLSYFGSQGVPRIFSDSCPAYLCECSDEQWLDSITELSSVARQEGCSFSPSPSSIGFSIPFIDSKGTVESLSAEEVWSLPPSNLIVGFFLLSF